MTDHAEHHRLALEKAERRKGAEERLKRVRTAQTILTNVSGAMLPSELGWMDLHDAMRACTRAIEKIHQAEMQCRELERAR